MTGFLSKYGTVTGIDLSELAMHFCHIRDACRLALASVTALPFPSASFELVTSFDVLYERGVVDDALALAEFFRVLGKGGRVLLRLPAYNWLRGQHDQGIHTARRYTAGQTSNLLQRAGFAVEQLSYANTLLFPAALLKRTAERLWPPRILQSDLAFNAGVANNILHRVLALEAPIVSRHYLPFGLSVFAVGRKS
jgi:SAM-dependent methyltransferase